MTEIAPDWPKPQFVTFTGVDDKTDLKRLEDLSSRYPIEWGILIGGRLGSNRYPSTILSIMETDHFDHQEVKANFSLHICGQYARAVLSGEESAYPTGYLNLPFKRFQINSIKYNMEAVSWFQKFVGRPVIIQTREKEFPDFDLEGVQCLHDLSGGKGKVPDYRPVQKLGSGLVGYAGGIGPDNAYLVWQSIDAHMYWIDMESKVRTDDWLDLDKCEDVCKQIWGVV